MEQRGVIGERIAFFGGARPASFWAFAVARAARASLGVNMVLFARFERSTETKGIDGEFLRIAWPVTELAIEGEPASRPRRLMRQRPMEWRISRSTR